MNKPCCLKKVPTEVYLKTEIQFINTTPEAKKFHVAKSVPNPPKITQKINKFQTCRNASVDIRRKPKSDQD